MAAVAEKDRVVFGDLAIDPLMAPHQLQHFEPGNAYGSQHQRYRQIIQVENRELEERSKIGHI